MSGIAYDIDKRTCQFAGIRRKLLKVEFIVKAERYIYGALTVTLEGNGGGTTVESRDDEATFQIEQTGL